MLLPRGVILLNLKCLFTFLASQNNLYVNMSKANSRFKASFFKKPANNEESQESLMTASVSNDQSMGLYEDRSMMRKYLKDILPYAHPSYLVVKYIGMIVMFILGTYVLWQCTVYFKEAKVQQEQIHSELNNFHISAEQKLKQLNVLQEVMEDKLENINILTEQGSKKIKDLFTFSKSDLLRDYEEDSGEQCEFIPLNLRFDCHPEDGASQLSCTQRGCCWHPLHQLNYEKQVPLDVPYCYYPKNWSLYKYKNFSKNGNDFSGFLRLQRNSFYKKDLSLVKIEAMGLDDSTMRVKISDAQNKRYEPPYPVRADPQPFSKVNNDAQYDFIMDENVPGFKIIRTSDKRSIFNSIGFGGFIFSDQFLQISSVLPSHNIYGIGEHRTNLKLNTNWQKLTLFTADQPPTENANLYGSHPFYMVVDNTGKAHGVLFLNSNAIDVILQPTPAITFRSIGGIFDIYFFMGPTPADVLKQYSQIVGKPFLPPYWSLGFHLCRYGYGTLENTKAVWQRTRDALIPFDTQWNDLDYMDKNNDFTYDKTKFKDLPNFIKELHDAGMHYIPLIDAGISASEKNGTYIPYDEGVRRGVFVYDTYNNEPFKGKVWNLVSTTWPDFTNPNTLDYYTEMMNMMHESFAYDGAWIDMNEPSNFYNGHMNGCENTNLDYPPYLPGVNDRLLAKKTICMSAKHHLGYHYDLHNTYGTSQAVVVNHALKKIRNKRPFIISRSTWEGHGFYAGHWTGDVYSSWHDLRMSIPEILAYSLFQIPMIGADICGFDGNTTEALCNRWMQLGAFYPFSRNHNSDDTIEQDPVAMGQMVVMSSKKALNTRYYFLPYLYTLFYRAHKYGETVARPLFVEFHEDPKTFNIDTQFLWGSCLMIAPVLDEGKTNVDAYLPRGVWYNYYTMESSFSIGKNYTLDAPLDTIPLLVRGGCVMPVQESSVTTTLSRQKPFGLLVALDESENAKGELYWDDGDSLDSIEKKEYKLFEFEAGNGMLTSKVGDGTFDVNMKLGNVIVMGISKVVKQVLLNDKEIDFEYDKEKSALKVENISLDFTMNFDLKWSDKKTERHLSTTAVPHVEPTSHAYPSVEELGVMNSAVSNFKTSILLVFYVSLFFNAIVIKYCVIY